MLESCSEELGVVHEQPKQERAISVHIRDEIKTHIDVPIIETKQINNNRLTTENPTSLWSTKTNTITLTKEITKIQATWDIIQDIESPFTAGVGWELPERRIDKIGDVRFSDEV